MEIGERINYYRKLLGLTQEEVATKLGTTPQNIYKYEKGIIKNIPLSSIVGMSELFGISPAELAGMTEPQNTSSSLFAEISEKEAFGIRLRAAREERGLSIRELAIKLHVIPYIVDELEKGTFDELQDSMLSKIAEFFGKDVEHFKSAPIADLASNIKLNDTERLVVVKYRANPQYHDAIHQLLGIASEDIDKPKPSYRYKKMTSSDFDNASNRAKIAQSAISVYHTEKPPKKEK